MWTCPSNFRLNLIFGCRAVNFLFNAIILSSTIRFARGNSSNFARNPFSRFFSTMGTKLMYVMRYRMNASRTYSGRSVRKCTTHAPHTNGPMNPTMKSIAWLVGRMLKYRTPGQNGYHSVSAVHCSR